MHIIPPKFWLYTNRNNLVKDRWLCFVFLLIVPRWFSLLSFDRGASFLFLLINYFNFVFKVYTDVKVVPIISTDEDDILNAYALDFYNHGNQKAIITENCIQHGDAFSLLKDFLLVIKSILVSLMELGPDDDDVIAAFKQLAHEYSAQFQKSFGCSF